MPFNTLPDLLQYSASMQSFCVCQRTKKSLSLRFFVCFSCRCYNILLLHLVMFALPLLISCYFLFNGVRSFLKGFSPFMFEGRRCQTRSFPLHETGLAVFIGDFHRFCYLFLSFFFCCFSPWSSCWRHSPPSSERMGGKCRFETDLMDGGELKCCFFFLRNFKAAIAIDCVVESYFFFLPRFQGCWIDWFW